MAAYAVFLERSFFGDFHDILRARPGLKGLLLHLEWTSMATVWRDDRAHTEEGSVLPL
jgi:hypothetical protein